MAQSSGYAGEVLPGGEEALIGQSYDSVGIADYVWIGGENKRWSGRGDSREVWLTMYVCMMDGWMDGYRVHIVSRSRAS
jgi:hypothetical protein